MTGPAPGPTRRRFLRRAALAAGSALAGCLDTGPTPAERADEHRDELERFADVSTALSEGYRSSATYVRADAGVLGVPFVNTRITGVEPTRPQAVLYGLTEAGTYEPLGLKWFVPAAEADGPPTLFGREFSGPMEGRSGLVPRHYALHVWLFRENPDGLFARYNPAVEPPAVVDDLERVRGALQGFLLGSDAEDAGYRNTETCISTDRGAYGIPFVRRDADGAGGTSPRDPPILLYRVTSNWQYVLMGAEWYVPADAAGTPSRLFGRELHEPADGHSPKTDQPEHYGLHAWLFRANPRGVFASFNPTVRC